MPAFESTLHIESSGRLSKLMDERVLVVLKAFLADFQGVQKAANNRREVMPGVGNQP